MEDKKALLVYKGATAASESEEDDVSDSDVKSEDSDSDSASTPSRVTTDDEAKPASSADDKVLPLKSGNGSSVSDIIAARRRKGERKECRICQEPRNGGKAVLCVHCKDMYHVQCLRSQYPKITIPQSRQWVCYDCEPKHRASPDEKKKKTKVKSRPASTTDAGVLEAEVTRLTELAAHGGKQMNSSILELTSEMQGVIQKLQQEAAQPVDGLHHLYEMTQQLQVFGMQFEVDMLTQSQPILKEEEVKSEVSSKPKGGASRLYSSRQIEKLEEWYQKSSRPGMKEIQAMYRMINSPEYADRELQPDGISVKQIRIWFDNRRAKERLDYMRVKMKNVATKEMDADSVKRMKTAYIDEAKEVLEARVAELREKGYGPEQIVDEADSLLLSSGGDRPLPGVNQTTVSHPGSYATSSHKVTTDEAELPPPSKKEQKKRIRIDFVASVRKAVHDAKEANLTEDEVKQKKQQAIDSARKRLYSPFNGTRPSPTKPLTKDEMDMIQDQMQNLLEEEAPSDQLTDFIELLSSAVMTKDVVSESRLVPQIETIQRMYLDDPELQRESNKLLEELHEIEESSDLMSRPDSPALSPESRRARVKFSLPQLVQLERAFRKDELPDKKRLERLAKKLSAIGEDDPNGDQAQRQIDYKQIRCWFYKRRAANAPPQALAQAAVPEEAMVESEESEEDKSLSMREKSVLPKEEEKDTWGKGGRIFNVKQLAVVLDEYEKNPRPSVQRMGELQLALNDPEKAGDQRAITKQQIKTWFANRRKKERTDMAKMHAGDKRPFDEDNEGEKKPRVEQ